MQEGSLGSPHILIKTERDRDSKAERQRERDTLPLETGWAQRVGTRSANQKALTVSTARGERRAGA